MSSVRVQEAAFDPGAEINTFLARNPNRVALRNFIAG